MATTDAGALGGAASALAEAAASVRVRGATLVGEGWERRIVCAPLPGEPEGAPRLAMLLGERGTPEDFLAVADEIAAATEGATAVRLAWTPYEVVDGVPRSPAPTMEECAAFNVGLLALPAPVTLFDLPLPDGAGRRVLVARAVPSRVGGIGAVAIREVEVLGGGIVAPMPFETVVEVVGWDVAALDGVVVLDEDDGVLEGEARDEALRGRLAKGARDPFGGMAAVARRMGLPDAGGGTTSAMTGDAELLVRVLARGRPGGDAAGATAN